jgi:hypothetical protein
MKLKDLENQRKTVENEIAARHEELKAIDVLIAAQRKRENLPPDPSIVSNNGTGEKQRRTRGILKAAKAAAANLEEFTRSELFEAVEAEYPALAGKIKPDAQRGSIRTLLADGLIETTDRKQEGETIYKSLKKV